MTILTAVHEIHHSDAEGKPLVIKAGRVHDFGEEHVEFLTKCGAVREPEERELLSYQHSIGKFIEAPVALTPAPRGHAADAAKTEDDDVG